MENMLPSSKELIEVIAKSIMRDRLFREASELISSAIGVKLPDTEEINERFTQEFENVWNAVGVEAEQCREDYRIDAQNAINSINLYLLTHVA